MENNKLNIINKVNSEGIIAIREKTSVQIDQELKTVTMHDYSYTFDEIIAIGDRIRAINKATKSLKFT